MVGPPDAAIARQKQEDLVIHAVQQAFHPDFLIRLKGVAPGPQQASQAAITRAVETWLSGFDWENEYERMLAGEHPDVPLHVEVQGTHLLMLPWPRYPEIRGDRAYPTVITFPGGGGLLNEGPALLDDLKDKAKKFGKPDLPFVIALMVTRPLAQARDIEVALYGPEVVRVPVSHDGTASGKAELARDPHAFWQWGEQQRGTRVSAVIAAIHLDPWRVSDATLRMWRNPWASNPLGDVLPWRTIDVDLETGLGHERPATVEPERSLRHRA